MVHLFELDVTVKSLFISVRVSCVRTKLTDRLLVVRMESVFGVRLNTLDSSCCCNGVASSVRLGILSERYGGLLIESRATAGKYIVVDEGVDYASREGKGGSGICSWHSACRIVMCE